jgi:hypothetical protein
MRQPVTSATELESGQSYEIYRDGEQVDKIHTMTVNPESDIAHVVIGEYDNPHEITISEWLDEYTIVPHSRGASTLDIVSQSLP